MQLRFIANLTLALALFSQATCSGGDAEHEAFDEHMVEEDLRALPEIAARPAFGARAVEADWDPFVALFGERSAAGVLRYVRARAKIFIPYAQFENTRGAVVPQPLVHESFLHSRRGDPKVPKEAIAAVNAGITLYLLGKVNDTTMEVFLGGRHIVATSPRVGLIGVPDDYLGALISQLKKRHPSIDPGRLAQVAQAVRQMTLVHEARHSDCAQEPTTEQVELARAATSVHDFIDQDMSACGHLHGMCTEGDLRGMPACDARPWGSYAVEGVYTMGVRDSAPVGSADYRFLDALWVASRARLMTYEARAMLRGELGPPDISSFDDPPVRQR